MCSGSLVLVFRRGLMPPNSEQTFTYSTMDQGNVFLQNSGTCLPGYVELLPGSSKLHWHHFRNSEINRANEEFHTPSWCICITHSCTDLNPFYQWRTEGGLGGVQTPPPRNSKFRRPSKIVPNSTRLWKLLKIAEFRTPTSQDVRKKGSKILKLPPVRNCFTLAMTNKLVVIINDLKVPKI